MEFKNFVLYLNNIQFNKINTDRLKCLDIRVLD